MKAKVAIVVIQNKKSKFKNKQILKKQQQIQIHRVIKKLKFKVV